MHLQKSHIKTAQFVNKAFPKNLIKLLFTLVNLMFFTLVVSIKEDNFQTVHIANR